MSKREKSYNEKLSKVKGIYENLFKEYNAIPQGERWRFCFKTRLCTTIQIQLAISEHKAQEWIRLVENLNKFNQSQQKP